MNSYIVAFAGLMLLSYCADTLVDSSVAIAHKYKLSKVFIGSAIIGFGSSLPEVMTTVSATTQNMPDLAISTVIGSNIANIGMLLALCLFLSKNWPDMKDHKQELIFFIISYVVLFASIFMGSIGQIQGLLMALLLIALLVISLRSSKCDDIEEAGEDESGIFTAILGVILGLIGLAFGADLLISGATDIARDLNISEKLIGLTLVALGTSLPELAASLSAVRKKETGMVIGNVIGSNMFNILAALGIAAFVSPIQINDFFIESIFLLILALALVPFFYIKKGNQKAYAVVLFIIYAIYMYVIIA